MSVLNRPMFNKQVVKRFEGSSQRGETANPEPILTRLFEMFKRLNPDYDPETDEFRQEEFKEEQEKSKNQVISKLYELIQKEDPESTLREGEFASEELTNKNPELYSLYNAFLADNIDSKEAEDDLKKYLDDKSVVREGEKNVDSLIKVFSKEDPNTPIFKKISEITSNPDLYSVTREGELPLDTNKVTREGEKSLFGITLPFKEGGEVDAEDVGIMDGFKEGEAEQIVQKGEEGKQKIDSAQDYSELMNSTRGDSASEEQRRDELAQYVGEKDAEQTPDSVLALIQPLMQMLDTEAGTTGIAASQQAQMNMPQPTPQMQGGIPGFKDGGIVYRNKGSNILGEMMNFEDQYLKESGVQENEDMKVAEQNLNLVNFLGTLDDVESGDTALKKKYDANYKIFSEILGGQGPSKDQMQGEMLTQVVAPLAFAYAQGAPLEEILATGSQKIGQMASAFDKLKRKDEAAIRNAALTQALKKEDDPLIKVFLKDDPNTPGDEGLQSVYRKTSEVIAFPDLYTAESVSKVEAEINKTIEETKGIEFDNAEKQIKLKYSDLLNQLDINEKEELIQSQILENKLKEIDINTKPELLKAQLEGLNLDNTEKVINNEFLRPEKVLELENLSTDLDIKIQDLKRKTIETEFAAQLQELDVLEKEALINEKLQTFDFNEVNNVLLLEEKRAEIDNLKLTGENLTLENEYDAIKNKFAEEGFTLENQTKAIDNLIKQQENIKLSIENEYLPQEKKLGLDKLNEEIELLQETNYGQIITNSKNEIELNNYSQEKELQLEKLKLETETLQYKLDNPEKDWTKIKQVNDFKNKWKDSSIYKNTVERQDMLQDLQTAADDNSGASDITFIFRYMKFLDPTSVVREGEFATAAEAGGVPEKFANLRDKILAGSILTSEVKQQFLEVANKMYITQLDNYQRTYDSESAIAERIFGVNEVENAIIPLSDIVDQRLLKRIQQKEVIADYLQSLIPSN
jgi:hypothetical protein